MVSHVVGRAFVVKRLGTMEDIHRSTTECSYAQLHLYAQVGETAPLVSSAQRQVTGRT